MGGRRDGTEVITVGGVALDVAQRGSGRPVLVLHGFDGPRTHSEFLDRLAGRARVIAPVHPGFAGSPVPDWIDAIDDLSYIYLGLIETLRLGELSVVGLSMGGWIAAEMAIKSTHRLSRLVLVDAVGIKVGDRETRDFPDIYALPPEEVTGLLWHDRTRAPAIAALSDDRLAAIAGDREAAALYVWEYYMHDPKLRRHLHRIDIPTLLLRGAQDGLVSADYAAAYCAAISGSRLETIPAAGHFPELEQPEILADRILCFIEQEV
jgi:pimeloyl-ACP methyl ester carboxylesterase